MRNPDSAPANAQSTEVDDEPESDDIGEFAPLSESSVTGQTMQVACERYTGRWCIEAGPTAHPSVTVLEGSGRLVLGTGEGADVKIVDRTVSARHCELVIRDGRMVVSDL